MSDEHDDDEIRESIQCVAFPHSMGGAVLPIGYSILFEPAGRCIQVLRRGVLVPGAHTEADAWSDAIAREKARRAREGQVSASDKATAMLAEVLRERDALMVILEDERARVILGKMEIDELRAKLERVQRWELVFVPCHGGYATRDEMHRDDGGGWVRWDDIAAIIGKDGVP